MLEKAAEEYVKAFTEHSHIWSNDKLMQLQLREAYKDGAVFGYSKAKEEAKDIIERMLSLLPSGYNDMGNCDFIWEVKEEAEEFLKGH